MSNVRRYVPSRFVDEAEVLHQFGRTKKAISLLRGALRENPSDTDVLSKLRELENFVAQPRKSLVLSGLVAWLLIAVSGAVALGPLFLVALSHDQLPAWYSSETGLALAYVCLFLLVIVGSIGWPFLFLHLWFSYLRRLPASRRAQIERNVPRYFNVHAFEPTYTRVRSKYFPQNGA
jgi:hypothetical protein